jgi:hypothetical protein
VAALAQHGDAILESLSNPESRTGRSGASSVCAEARRTQHCEYLRLMLRKDDESWNKARASHGAKDTTSCNSSCTLRCALSALQPVRRDRRDRGADRQLCAASRADVWADVAHRKACCSYMRGMTNGDVGHPRPRGCSGVGGSDADLQPRAVLSGSR